VLRGVAVLLGGARVVWWGWRGPVWRDGFGADFVSGVGVRGVGVVGVVGGVGVEGDEVGEVVAELFEEGDEQVVFERRERVMLSGVLD
ncbi:hypothetical protein ACPTFC_34595, partial [Pseudomonas aeruginosa]